MTDKAFEKALKQDEKAAAATLEKLLTEALNSKETQKEAAKVTGSSQPWPVPPEKNILSLYNKVMKKSWAKAKGSYSQFKVGIEVIAPKGKTPSAKVTCAYEGEWKGGSSHWLKKGETVFKIAETVYGHDVYASAIWEANPKLLGTDKAYPVPAGYEIKCPRVWVPKWINPPKIAVSPDYKIKAVDVPLPSFTVDVDRAVTKEFKAVGPGCIVKGVLELKVAGEATRPGTMDASINLKSLEAEVAKDLGPLGGKFTLDIKGKKGDLELVVVNKAIAGMTFTLALDLLSGSFKAVLGSREISGKLGKTEYKAKVSLTIKGEIILNAQLKPERIREFDPEPKGVIDLKAVKKAAEKDPTLLPKATLVLLMGAAIMLRLQPARR